MAIEDIERLKEKIEKDPNSKLFVPLAEEYKKAGMYDEAIDLLTKGLERQPGYLSARVSLGKIYIERGMLNEAMVEFEKVIAAIPDNLYAHKKLSEIYRDLGEKDKAVKEFRMVLKLNPMDEGAASSLAEIEGAPGVQPKEQIEKKSEEILHIEEDLSKIEEEKFEPPLTERDKELSAVLPETKEEKEEKEIPAEIPISEEDMELWEVPSEMTEEIKEAKEKTPEISVSEEDMELWKSHLEATKEGQERGIAETVIEAEKLPDEEPVSFEDILKEPEALIENPELAVKEKEVSKQPNIAAADQYILQGQYLEALNVYKNLLSIEPDNKHILQRLEELKILLKLLGKDKEALIAKLDSFLEGIRKRRDEFFGSS